ncbi:MAG: DUF4058 family protein [Leptolyngbya sp. SIOISBB]|nr:DUF4058 family protein [Leptolyngbya sp. SIOISBB]
MGVLACPTPPKVEQLCKLKGKQLNLPDPIPIFPLPLKVGDREPLIDLKPILDALYNRAGYALRLDFDAPPPGTTAEEQTWIRQILTAAPDNSPAS